MHPHYVLHARQSAINEDISAKSLKVKTLRWKPRSDRKYCDLNTVSSLRLDWLFQICIVHTFDSHLVTRMHRKWSLIGRRVVHSEQKYCAFNYCCVIILAKQTQLWSLEVTAEDSKRPQDERTPVKSDIFKIKNIAFQICISQQRDSNSIELHKWIKIILHNQKSNRTEQLTTSIRKVNKQKQRKMTQKSIIQKRTWYLMF